jgi:hypothetical protein
MHINAFSRQLRRSQDIDIKNRPTYLTYVAHEQPIDDEVQQQLNNDVVQEHSTTIASVHAATSATQEEIELAKKLKDSDPRAKPVVTEQKIWRPQVISQYKEPDCFPDPSSDLEVIFKDYGKPL